MYKVRMMISIFQGWPRKIPGSYTLVAGFLIHHYTRRYTSCILCETGGILPYEQAPGEDGKKFGERETEEFGEQSDRGGDREACRLCF